MFSARTIPPDGTCVRDYSTSDIAIPRRALEAIDRVTGELNVGNSRGFSILEVIDVAERITAAKSPQTRSAPPGILQSGRQQGKLKKALAGKLPFFARRIIQSPGRGSKNTPRLCG